MYTCTHSKGCKVTFFLRPTVKRGCIPTTSHSVLVHFALQVDFVLMHEFKGADFFDWHVDTKPGDGTGRTVNVNVMLSNAALGQQPGQQTAGYVGGGLRVGECDLQPQKGDLYWYPANYPHKVEDVESGTRHTLVMAVKTSDAARAASDYWERGLANFARLTTGEKKAVVVSPTNEGVGVSALGSKMAAAQATVAASRGAAAAAQRKRRAPSKWHWLHSEALQRTPGQEAEAGNAIAQAYACTQQASQYAQKFDEDGQRLVASGGPLVEALPYFAMAARIEAFRADRDGDGEEPLYASHVQAIQAALKGAP